MVLWDVYRNGDIFRLLDERYWHIIGMVAEVLLEIHVLTVYVCQRLFSTPLFH